MKKAFRFSIQMGFMFMVILCVLAPTIVHAEVPSTINYQGYLADDEGTPVPDGIYEMHFYLFDEQIGGSQLWNPSSGEMQDVTVTNGVYNVQLGINQPLDSSVFDGGVAWLEVVVEGETLSPRQRVTATAYALKAGDADTLAGNAVVDLDVRYVNEGQVGVVSSAMIHDSAVTADDLATSSVASSEILDNSVTVNDLGPNSVGSSEVIDNSLTASDLAAGSVGASEIAAGAVGTSEIADSSVTAADLAADSVGYSEIATNAVREDEIRWSLNHTAADLNGGILHLTNSSNATAGNFPMGVSGQATGDPASNNPVIGVFGGAPGLGQGAPVGSLPDTKIGVAGASDTGHGVAGVATSGYGVYARSENSYGLYAYSPNSYAVYGYGDTRGVYGYAIDQYGTGAYGYSNGTNGYGVRGSCGGSSGYGGYFSASSTYGVGVYAYGGASGYAADFRGVVRIRDRNSGATVMELGSGLDYAEGFDVSDSAKPDPGSVLIIDSEHPGKLTVSTTAYDTKVAGIVAGANGLGSGVRLGADQFDNDVALAGRVFCKVDASGSAIRTGDLLTTADLPGYAMKAGDYARAQGAILGKAMQDLEKGQKGKILVLVTLQ